MLVVTFIVFYVVAVGLRVTFLDAGIIVWTWWIVLLECVKVILIGIIFTVFIIAVLFFMIAILFSMIAVPFSTKSINLRETVFIQIF